MTTVYLLTGDIGGTNSRMRLYATGSHIALAETDYRNEEALIEKHDGAFEEYIVAPFLQECWRTVKNLSSIERADIIACFACAGPVRNNAAHLSNLGVTIDGKAIEGSVYCQEIYVRQIKRALIINDFVAQGYGCLTLEREELRELTPRSHKNMDCTGPKVCVGAGTGLGQCFLTRDGTGYTCYPSEGGHVEYNPRSDLEIKLRSYLMKKFNCTHRTSVERVVSGIGLANVYQFLVEEFPDRVDQKVHEEFKSAGDMKGKIVSDNAIEGSLCKQALDIMIR
jgi:glucokinase